MIHNKLRQGNPTSSKASLLMVNGKGPYGFGEGAVTYANEKAMERLLGRSVDSEVNKREMTWGKFMEKMLFMDWRKVGLDFDLTSVDTAVHPKYKFWAGSVDFLSVESAGESKSFFLKNHIKLCRVLITGDLELLKKEYADIYWQVTSNGEIHKRPFCDVFAYCPTRSELEAIRDKYDDAFGIQSLMGDEPFKYRFIIDDDIETLPYIPDNTKVPSFARMRFKKKPEDVVALTRRMMDFELLVQQLVKDFDF